MKLFNTKLSFLLLYFIIQCGSAKPTNSAEFSSQPPAPIFANYDQFIKGINSEHANFFWSRKETTPFGYNCANGKVYEYSENANRVVAEIENDFDCINYLVQFIFVNQCHTDWIFPIKRYLDSRTVRERKANTVREQMFVFTAKNNNNETQIVESLPYSKTVTGLSHDLTQTYGAKLGSENKVVVPLVKEHFFIILNEIWPIKVDGTSDKTKTMGPHQMKVPPFTKINLTYEMIKYDCIYDRHFDFEIDDVGLPILEKLKWFMANQNESIGRFYVNDSTVGFKYESNAIVLKNYPMTETMSEFDIETTIGPELPLDPNEK